MTPEQEAKHRAAVNKADKIQGYLNDPDMQRFLDKFKQDIERERKKCNPFEHHERLCLLYIEERVVDNLIANWKNLAKSGASHLVALAQDEKSIGTIAQFNKRRASG